MPAAEAFNPLLFLARQLIKLVPAGLLLTIKGVSAKLCCWLVVVAKTGPYHLALFLPTTEVRSATPSCSSSGTLLMALRSYPAQV